VRRLFSILIPISFAALGVALADDWNSGTGGKPSRNSLSNERGPVTATILWAGGLPAVIAQPPVTEGNLVAMSRIQNINDVLHGTLIVVHNLTTGDTLWTKDLPVDFPATDWRNRVSAMRDGRVYATRSGNDNYSFLYALEASTGAILWRSQDSIGESSTESASFAPNGDLIVGSFRDVTRIKAADGTRVWRSNRTSPTSNGNEVAVYGNHCYLWEASTQGPKVSVFDLTTGLYLYSSQGIGGGFVQQLGLFVGLNGTVFAPRTQNNIASDFLVAFRDVDTALAEKWRVPLGYVPFASFGTGPDSTVYSYTHDDRVIRIDPVTGSVIDSSEILMSDFFQPRMAVDSTGVIYVSNGGFSQGTLYSLNPDLSMRWSVSVPNINIGGPALGSNSTLVVCGTGNDVRAFRTGPAGVSASENVPELSLPILYQNYPNPFNPSTKIRFEIKENRRVVLRVFDVLGKEITTLVDGMMGPGEYERTFDASSLAAGVYFYRLESDQFVSTKRFVVVK
jgi:outer membrane protein assembly factor BamB